MRRGCGSDARARGYTEKKGMVACWANRGVDEWKQRRGSSRNSSLRGEVMAIWSGLFEARQGKIDGGGDAQGGSSGDVRTGQFEHGRATAWRWWVGLIGDVCSHVMG